MGHVEAASVDESRTLPEDNPLRTLLSLPVLPLKFSRRLFPGELWLEHDESLETSLKEVHVNDVSTVLHVVSTLPDDTLRSLAGSRGPEQSKRPAGNRLFPFVPLDILCHPLFHRHFVEDFAEILAVDHFAAPDAQHRSLCLQALPGTGRELRPPEALPLLALLIAFTGVDELEIASLPHLPYPNTLRCTLAERLDVALANLDSDLTLLTN